MNVEKFTEILGADFYAGVPDSQLKPLCDYLMNKFGVNPSKHIVAANEGNCAAIAAGYNLATGKIPVVYMQNSGEGNIVNPVLSLLSQKVYAIPMIFVIGWRGEPELHDEPQHIHQGAVTLQILRDLGIEFYVVDKNTSESDLKASRDSFQSLLDAGKQVAFVIRRSALSYDNPASYGNENKLLREDALAKILQKAGTDIIVATTGKTGREVFELREKTGEGHERDFLTVGSMGHCSSIALGIAQNAPARRIWCLDGDGAFLMHMGAAAVIGACSPKNLVHVVLNNCAHESVGGIPTVMDKVDLPSIAKACGYKNIFSASNIQALDLAINEIISTDGLTFVEIKCAVGSRKNLGRPTIAPADNKISFCNALR